MAELRPENRIVEDLPFGMVLPSNEATVFFGTQGTGQANILRYRIFYGYSSQTEVERIQSMLET